MGILKHIGELFFSYIIIKGVIAPRVTDLFKKYILNPAYKWFTKTFVRTSREATIWLHYRNKAMNKGHDHSIEDCSDGKCVIL